MSPPVATAPPPSTKAPILLFDSAFTKFLVSEGAICPSFFPTNDLAEAKPFPTISPNFPGSFPTFAIRSAPNFLIEFGTNFPNNLNNFPGRDLSLLISHVPTGRPRNNVFMSPPIESSRPPNSPPPASAIALAAPLTLAPNLAAIASNALADLSLNENSALCFFSSSSLSLLCTFIGVPSGPFVIATGLPSASDV